MFTCLNSAPTARNAATVCAEKPHCGKSGVPFMNSTTGLEPSSALILSTTSIDLPLQKFAPALQLGDHPPLLGGAHGRPAADLIGGPQAAHAIPLLIERADLGARGTGTVPLRRYLWFGHPGR